MDKGDAKDDLVALRRLICERFITEPGYRFVTLPDPKRATDVSYEQAVTDWHAARAELWAQAIEADLGPDGVGAFLAWGDPSLYDSTLRILDRVAEHVEFEFDVIPGITAIQALTARHRIPLNDIGEAVLITTGRRLRGRGPARGGRGDARRRMFIPANAARHPDLVGGLPRHAGRATGARRGGGGRSTDRRNASRGKERHGWIMDIYLLRTADCRS